MRDDLTRREVLKTTLITTIGAASMATGCSNPGRGKSAAPSIAQAGAANPEHTFGHTIAFGDEYHARIIEIMEAVRRTEMPATEDVSARMAAAVRGGNSVWLQAKQGHMPRHELDMANSGNPGLFGSNGEWDDGEYDKMRAGDVLVTNYINDNVARVRKAGVYVAGVTVSYQDTPSAPRGLINPNANGWYLSDVSDVIIDSHSPMEQGIVTCPEIPEMKIAPSSANPLTAVFWMLTAEGANKLANPASKGAPMAERFLDTTIERITAAYQPQRERIFEAAATAAKKIGAGARFHVTSDHRGVEEEATGTASGPMMTNAFRKEKRKGDVHLLAAIEPDSPKIITEAKVAREKGQYVVSIGPAGSKEIAAVSDVFIDNHCPEGGGLVEVPGYAERIGAAGGILNNILAWCFTAQMVDEMVRRGWVPWFWMGFYLRGGKEYDEAVGPLFQRQGF
jgi:uncharacterized phosphosugar-binding protein